MPPALQIALLVLISAHGAGFAGQVAVAPKEPFGIINVATNAHVLSAAALAHTQVLATGAEEVIAWAAKYSDTSVPPPLMEEVIVLARWTDPGGAPHFTLAYLYSWGGQDSERRWALSPTAPALPCRKEFPSAPSPAEIASFIHSTNFGWNEANPRLIPIKVIAYSEDQVSGLEAGLSNAERKRRWSQLISLYSR
jgi:hypothetical protein